MTLDYTWEKFFVAVLGLSRSTNSLQDRLGDAYVSSLIRLTPDDLPRDLQHKFAEFQKRMVRERPVGDEGAVQATTNKMSEEEARTLIEQVVSLYDAVTRELGPMR